uniref:Histone domain-containing protein n=1 Tax=Globodera pallida TaxID=36090 RepID=A0A183CNW4_GLOPA
MVRVRRRRRKKLEPRKRSYKLYIRRVLTKVQPNKEIGMRTLNIMSSFVNDLFDRIASEATRISHADRRQTIMLRDMHYALRLIMVAEMAERTHERASDSLKKYKLSRARRSCFCV